MIRTSVIVVALLLLGGQTVEAKPLKYHGGPVLESFTIHPLYWGSWSKKERDTKQAYLKNLAAYISGDHAPDGKEPVTKQYGVNKATVVDNERTIDSTTSCLQLVPGHTCPIQREDIAGPISGPLLTTSIIARAQAREKDPLPAFGLHSLIVVFVPHNYVLTDCDPFKSCGAAYHSSESPKEFWAVVPEDDTPASIGHEVLEASANPADDNAQGWDEVADPCGKLVTLGDDLGSIQIPRLADNTRGGACNRTGYIPTQDRFNQLTFDIQTGGDNLRGDSSATASISLPEGPQTFTLKSQSDASWDNNTDHVRPFTLAGPALPLSLFGTITITLTSHNGFTETDDNWDIQSIAVTAKGSGESSCVLKQSGLVRLTGSNPSVALHPRAGC